MTKKIATVGFSLPDGNSETIPLESKRSLLDYDIAVFKPSIIDFFSYGDDEYQGKRSLNDTKSFSLKEYLEHWRREISDALKSGKSIFILCNEKEEAYVATGDVTYSGTGRNRQPTRIVTLTSNYSMIPIAINFINAEGNQMSLVGGNTFLGSYWTDMSDGSQYKVFIESAHIQPLIRAGDKVVGGFYKSKNSDSCIVFLPSVNFYQDSFFSKNKEKDYWNKEGISFCRKFISALHQTEKNIRSDNAGTSKPDWAGQERFLLSEEKKIQQEMLKIETDIEKLSEQKNFYQQELDNKQSLKRLLFEQGKPLEAAIIDALILLGFNAKPYKDNTSEFDVIFESEEGRLLGEAEGKDNKAINIEKMRQLHMNILEDFSKEGVEVIAKGVLIGNAYRLLPPEERKEFFTEKCLTSAETYKIALVRSIDLFDAVKYILDQSDKDFAKKCREVIIGSTGIVNFPKIPTSQVEEKASMAI